MPELFIIDDNWQEQPWFSTGGTRAKKYLSSPDGKYYYFKRSHYKPSIGNNSEKDYKYEFWSEIIAYEVGKALKFNVLRYDIAIDAEVVGCISENMINAEKEELIEGIKYLQAYDNSFNPERNNLRHKYTFELIDSAFDQFKLGKFKEDLLKMFVFDAIIGNGDRHQENWAIISEYISISETPINWGMNEIQEDFPRLRSIEKLWIKRFINWVSKFSKKKEVVELFERKKIELERKKLISTIDKRFAPIYDNGSSLGRELTDERVTELIKDESKIKLYISKGLSEIHWREKKISHFSFLEKMRNSAYCEIIEKIISGVLDNFDKNEIEKIVLNIDEKLPESYRRYKIPEERKKLITKLITLRIEKLKELI